MLHIFNDTIGGWVGSRAVLGTVVTKKIHSLRRRSNSGTLIIQPVAQRCTDWAAMAQHGWLSRRWRFKLKCSWLWRSVVLC